MKLITRYTKTHDSLFRGDDYVYLAYDSKNKLTKIGRTCEMKSRFCALQSSNPIRIKSLTKKIFILFSNIKE